MVANANHLRKIYFYFPREVFPLTAVTFKPVELGINFVTLAGLMLWVPVRSINASLRNRVLSVAARYEEGYGRLHPVHR